MALKSVKGGFTLIEVIVSVLLISIVGMALLEISSKNTRVISFLEKKREVPIALSFIAFHGTPDGNNLEKTLLDIIDADYNIESDRLKRYLESKKVLYKERSVDRINFGESEESEDSGMTQQIEIFRQSILMDKLAGDIFTVRIE